MLSPKEQQLLDDMDQLLHEADPRFTRGFDLSVAQQRHRHRAEMRLFLLIVIGALVLSAGVAAMMFDPLTGSLIAGLGCGFLFSVVRTARRYPTRPTLTSTS